MPYKRRNADFIPLWGPKYTYFRQSRWKKLSMFQITYGHENAPELTYLYPLRYVSIRKCRNIEIMPWRCRHADMCAPYCRY